MLAIGTMQDARHCSGINDCDTDALSRRVRGLQNTGADNLRNQAGSLSSPVAVDFRLSSILKTLYSVSDSKPSSEPVFNKHG